MAERGVKRWRMVVAIGHRPRVVPGNGAPRTRERGRGTRTIVRSPRAKISARSAHPLQLALPYVHGLPVVPLGLEEHACGEAAHLLTAERAAGLRGAVADEGVDHELRDADRGPAQLLRQGFEQHVLRGGRDGDEAGARAWP